MQLLLVIIRRAEADCHYLYAFAVIFYLFFVLGSFAPLRSPTQNRSCCRRGLQCRPSLQLPGTLVLSPGPAPVSKPAPKALDSDVELEAGTGYTSQPSNVRQHAVTAYYSAAPSTPHAQRPLSPLSVNGITDALDCDAVAQPGPAGAALPLVSESKEASFFPIVLGKIRGTTLDGATKMLPGPRWHLQRRLCHATPSVDNSHLKTTTSSSFCMTFEVPLSTLASVCALEKIEARASERASVAVLRDDTAVDEELKSRRDNSASTIPSSAAPERTNTPPEIIFEPWSVTPLEHALAKYAAGNEALRREIITADPPGGNGVADPSESVRSTFDKQDSRIRRLSAILDGLKTLHASWQKEAAELVHKIATDAAPAPAASDHIHATPPRKHRDRTRATIPSAVESLAFFRLLLRRSVPFALARYGDGELDLIRHAQYAESMDGPGQSIQTAFEGRERCLVQELLKKPLELAMGKTSWSFSTSRETATLSGGSSSEQASGALSAWNVFVGLPVYFCGEGLWRKKAQFGGGGRLNFLRSYVADVMGLCDSTGTTFAGRQMFHSWEFGNANWPGFKALVQDLAQHARDRTTLLFGDRDGEADTVRRLFSEQRARAEAAVLAFPASRGLYIPFIKTGSNSTSLHWFLSKVFRGRGGTGEGAESWKTGSSEASTYDCNERRSDWMEEVREGLRPFQELARAFPFQSHHERAGTLGPERRLPHIFLFALGPLSKLLIAVMQEANPFNVYLDVGSAIDGLLPEGNTAKRATRDYHTDWLHAGGATTKEQNCTISRFEIGVGGTAPGFYGCGPCCLRSVVGGGAGEGRERESGALFSLASKDWLNRKQKD